MTSAFSETEPEITDLVKGWQRIGVRFKNPKDFGEIAAALSNAAVPFSHAGFLTLVFSQAQFVLIPDPLRDSLQEMMSNQLVELFSVASTGKRALVTPIKAKQLLKKLAQDF
jgi:hypothetical protein